MVKASSVFGLARWTVLLLGIGLALVYLNSAAHSGWASRGPPTGVPAAWLELESGQLLDLFCPQCDGDGAVVP